MREWTQRHIEELIDKHAGGGESASAIPYLANFAHWNHMDVELFHGSQTLGSRTLSVMLGSEKIDLQGSSVDFLSISMRVNTDLIVPRGDILDAALPQPRSSLTNPITSRYEWRVLDEPGWPGSAVESGTVLKAAPQTVLQDYSSTFNSGVPIRTQQIYGGGISTLSITGNRRAVVFRFGDNWHYNQFPSNIIASSGGGEMDLYMTCIRVNGGLSEAMGRLCPLRTT